MNLVLGFFLLSIYIYVMIKTSIAKFLAHIIYFPKVRKNTDGTITVRFVVDGRQHFVVLRRKLRGKHVYAAVDQEGRCIIDTHDKFTSYEQVDPNPSHMGCDSIVTWNLDDEMRVIDKHTSIGYDIDSK